MFDFGLGSVSLHEFFVVSVFEFIRAEIRSAAPVARSLLGNRSFIEFEIVTFDPASFEILTFLRMIRSAEALHIMRES